MKQLRRPLNSQGACGDKLAGKNMQFFRTVKRLRGDSDRVCSDQSCQSKGMLQSAGREQVYPEGTSYLRCLNWWKTISHVS